MNRHHPRPRQTATAAACTLLFVAGSLAATSAHAQTFFTWNGGTGNWSDAAFWTGGVPNSNLADVFVDGGKAINSVVNVNGAYTVGRLTISTGDTVNLNNGQSFTLSSAGGFAGAGTLNNNGAFTVGSTGSFTDFFIQGGGTFTGTGTFTLANADRVRGGGTLTNTATHTIQGETNNSGSLGSDEIAINNAGLINANVAGLALLVDPNATGLTNTGTLRASNGGVLVLTGNGNGAFNNAGGTVEALAGSEVRLTTGATVTGGTLRGVGNGTVRNTGGATLSGLTLGGSFVVDNGQPTTLVGTITNNGTINVNSAGSFTDVFVTGTGTTLAGSGTLTLANADRVRGGGTLTNAAGHTIQGETSNSGSLGSDEIAINNAGLINANVAGLALVVDPNATGLTNTGTGTLRASGGGLLVLTGNGNGAFTNNNVIEALAGSEVQLTAGASVTGGTLRTVGTGIIRNVSGATLSNLTLNGALAINNGQGTVLGGTITNNGTIGVNSTGSFTDVSLNGNVTLAGTGTLTLANADRVRGGGVLTNAAGHTIQGETNNSGSLGTNEIALNNAGTIQANVSGLALVVDPSAGGLTNATTGTLRATGGGQLVLTGNGGGSFTNNGTIDVRPGSAATVSTGALTNYTGNTLTGGTYLVTGSGAAGGAATLNLGGGTITTNAARVVLSGSNSVFAEINALANNQGTFGVVGGRSFTTAGALADSGTLLVGGGSQLTVNGALTESAAGTLAGSGTVTAAGLTLAGAVSPGGGFDAAGMQISGRGRLTLVGSTSLTSSAALVYELGLPDQVSSDSILVTGAFTLDGTLNVTALAGFGAGRYDLIDYSGSFVNNVLNLGTLPAGYNYSIDLATPGQVALLVSVVPEPAGWLWLALGGAAVAGWTRRARAAAGRRS